MQYALLIYSKPGAAEALDADEREANHREYMDIKKLPAVVGGASLHPVETATTVRVQDGQTLVTDGPFADTKEVFGGFYLIDADDLAEASEIAAQRWPDTGTPDNPGAWLLTTARHRAIDRLRRDRVLAAKLPLLAQQPDTAEDVVTEPPIPDERLELVFMCCHPALAIEAQVALTLRAVAGLATEEIARAFLVPAETMKRRLTRAKSKIKVAGIPFGVPAAAQMPERLAAVLAVVYLIFNEGYSDANAENSLAAEAIRLGRVVAALLPAEPEVLGLLALMLLHDARREARFDGQDLVLLPDQDQSRWDWRQITEARDLLARAWSARAWSARAWSAR